ncbi:hypothetical protein RchiOBHm_Chr1g0321791 [Rosa chinensis]|uniref:DUF247 domain protein n=1 Tax=Rosa chinensis TaxID=74649 RepID=A0A2P6S933_ROSCH|nr:hypothetical protein RchiOBHm_Chr1g0321791 [Rosa chinensis]
MSGFSQHEQERRRMEVNNQATPNEIVNPLEASMGEKLYNLSPVSPMRCIYRVPNRLRHANEKAYTPNLVSIGTFHHGNEALKPMEEHKMRYLKAFLGRSTLSLSGYILKIKAQEERLRSCYIETIELDSDEFARIILVDAAFIIEVLLRSYYDHLVDANDCIFRRPKLIWDLWPDMLLLENQLPFFILEDLCPQLINSSSGGTTRRLSMVVLSLEFFNNWRILGIEGTVQENDVKIRSQQEVKHLLDLLRTLLMLPMLESQNGGNFHFPPSTTKLHQAGVKFKVGPRKSLSSIQFIDGILEIPKLILEDHTELIMRNVVAYEQCNFPSKCCVSDYVLVLDSLVDTAKDVELLIDYGIFENCLGDSNEVSRWINSLNIGVGYSGDFYFSTVCQNLTKHCDVGWHKRMANLRQNYFNTPWRTISVVAAGILLVLTFVQTVCSVISVA